MAPQHPGNKLHLQLIGILLMIAGVVAWMRFANGVRVSSGAFRSRDALVVASPKPTPRSVVALTGKLVGVAVLADSIEIWSSNKVLLATVKPSLSHAFTARFEKTNIGNLALVARAGEVLLTIQSGHDIDNFDGVELGAGKSVTFTTRFVDISSNPVWVDLFGDVRVGEVTIPLNQKSDLVVSDSGTLRVQGLPPNGFISLGVHNREYAQTYALKDIALRSEPIRVFPKVKVNPANQIHGTIVDVAGRPVAGVQVHIESNIRRFEMPETQTDKLGHFSFSRLPNGIFSIQAMSATVSDMLTAPASGIRCSGGETVDVHQLTFAQGNFVDFKIEDVSLINRQPVFLEISGGGSGRGWVMTHLVRHDRPSRILVPCGNVRFQASQQPRNGILPSFRNVSIAPQTLDVRPSTSQKVIVQIRQRLR